MSRRVTILLFEDERRWTGLFERIVADVRREKAPTYDVIHHCASTLDEAKRLLDRESPQIIVSDVYIEHSGITEEAQRQTGEFVAAMSQLCTDEGKIPESSIRMLLDLRQAGYDMSHYYQRDGLQLLDTVRNSANANALFILWSSKLFCAVSRLKEVTRMKRGPDFILPKPLFANDDPDLRDRLRLGVDAIGSGLWEQVRKLLPWIRPLILGS